MKHIIKNICTAIIISTFFIYLQSSLTSTYISNFLKSNLITIIISLLAINIATTGIVLGKMKDIVDNTKNKTLFVKSKKEMQISIIEQVVLIVLAFMVLTFSDSPFIQNMQILRNILDICCLAIFVYDTIILYDSSKSIFIILSF